MSADEWHEDPLEIQRSVPVTIMRGGTSKGVFIEEQYLPPAGAQRNRILLSLMGSPDPMQIDGLGGTHSSTSKVMVVGPSEEPGVDLGYWFAQIGVDQAVVDSSGNCGNLTTAVAPFAIENKIIDVADGEATIRMKNLNTGIVIESIVKVRQGHAQVRGDVAVSGVPGTGAPIHAKYLDPAGGVLGKALPTGARADRIAVGDVAYQVSILDVTHPVVFAESSGFGLDLRSVNTNALNQQPDLLAAIERLRGTCAVRLGTAESAERAAAESSTIPNIVLLQPSDEPGADILALAVSMGKFHHALPVTVSLCMAAAADIAGTLVHGLVPGKERGALRIKHPKGTIEVSAEVQDAGAAPIVKSVGVVRTARKLLSGTAYYEDNSDR